VGLEDPSWWVMNSASREGGPSSVICEVFVRRADLASWGGQWLQ
jgi:hypothetical protein